MFKTMETKNYTGIGELKSTLIDRTLSRTVEYNIDNSFNIGNAERFRHIRRDNSSSIKISRIRQ